MSRYLIKEAHSGLTLAEFWADSERDALAKYSLSEGFADPRNADDGEGYFYTADVEKNGEGILYMTFLNTDLYAIKIGG